MNGKEMQSHSLQTSGLGAGALHVLSESQAELVQLLLQHSKLPLDNQDVLQGHKEAKSEGQTAPEAAAAEVQRLSGAHPAGFLSAERQKPGEVCRAGSGI